MVLLTGDHFGGRVAWAATGCLKRVVIRVSVRQAEVNDFNVVLIVK